MIIVKITVLLSLVVGFFVLAFKAWCNKNPFKAYIEDYPWWAYVMEILVLLNFVGIFASMIWFLFIFW